MEQYVDFSVEGNIPDGIVDAFVQKIVVSKDGFDWYLRCDPERAERYMVTGRKGTAQVSALSAQNSYITSLQHRLLLKVDGSFLSFETKIGFDQAYQYQKEHGHVLRKSRWKDITVKVMVDVG